MAAVVSETPPAAGEKMRFNLRGTPALLAVASLSLSGCGSDSTGPGNLDSASALQSLALGLQQFGGEGTTATLEVNSAFGGIAPFLNQVTVTIDGAQQTMFGLGLRETFPAGTCEEQLFVNILPSDPGTCTPPPLGLAVFLWQSHSPSEPPDRMALLVGDEGTTNFDINATTDELPAVAIYAEGQDNLWDALSGTLTSQVAATSQSCNLPLPPYAKNGTCSIATFDEQGSIVFEPFTLSGNSTKTLTLTIPRQTLHGLWVAITEVQPIPFTATRVLTPSLLGQRLPHARY